MKIKLTDHLGGSPSLLGFVFIEAISERESTEPGFLKSLVDESVADKNHYDLQIFVNGKELPLKAVFDAWEKQIDQMLCRKAEDLLNEKLNMANFSDIMSALERGLKDKLQAEFPDIELKDRW